MSSQLLAPQGQEIARTMEQVILQNDLSKLSTEDRVAYYLQLCDAVGINPLGRPFLYITLNNKLTLYATKDCTDQLRKRDGVNIQIAARDVVEGVYVVTARATTPNGRFDESTGAVPVDKLSGEAKANAYMKAETKAKRRVTLSICGLGMLDESEIDSIPNAQPLNTDPMARHIATIAPRQQPPVVHNQPPADDAPLFSDVAPPIAANATRDALIFRLKAVRDGARALGLNISQLNAGLVKSMPEKALHGEIDDARQLLIDKIQNLMSELGDGVTRDELTLDLDAMTDTDLIALAADLKSRWHASIAV